MFLNGCGSKGKIAAVVNGHVITVADLDQRMDSLTPNARASLGNDSAQLLEQMVMERVLIQEARRRSLDKDEEVRSLLEAAKRQILVGRLIDDIREEEPAQISDSEMAAFYSANPSQFQEPETFRASHILVQEEAQAQQALARVQAGEAFADVAAAVSVDPSKARGGDIGVFTSGQIIPEFEAACKELKSGEVSGVVKSSLGYHVILLTEHRAARQLPFEEIDERLREQMLTRRRQRRVEARVQELRSTAQVQIREPSLAPGVDAPPAAEIPSNPTP